jgi:hypothetical protein
MPLTHQETANVDPPVIKYNGIYRAPNISPNIPLIVAQTILFVFFDILNAIKDIPTNIAQIYKYPIDQMLNPYIKISNNTYIAIGYIDLNPNTIVYAIKSRDTGSTFGKEDIANFNANINVPRIPYKQISLVFIFI